MEYIKLIRSNREFAKLWAAQVVSLLGDWFSTIVVSALIVTYTEGSGYQGIAISGFLIARLVPPLLMRPLSGVLADRFNRKRLLIWSDVLRALAVCGLLFTTRGPEYLPLVYIFIIIQFLVSSIFEPARNAIMPSVLFRHQLVIGNTLSSVTWSAMLAIGAIVGGIVAELFGTQMALLIDALTFLGSAFIVVTIAIPASPRSEIGQPKREIQDKAQAHLRGRHPLPAAPSGNGGGTLRQERAKHHHRRCPADHLRDASFRHWGSGHHIDGDLVGSLWRWRHHRTHYHESIQ